MTERERVLAMRKGAEEKCEEEGARWAVESPAATMGAMNTRHRIRRLARRWQEGAP